MRRTSAAIILVLVIASIHSCRSNRLFQKSEPIQFHSGACFGRCPVYSISIDRSGRAELNAGRFCEVEGNFTMQLNGIQEAELSTLIKRIKKLENDSFGWMVQDLPGILIDLPASDVHIRARLDYPETVKETISFFSALRQSNAWTELKNSSQNIED